MKEEWNVRAIMVMFDTLSRRMLSPYGCDWVKTPNFERLKERTVTFSHAYVGSMPCMPARRELHTGRYNFLHRSWGPLEPFDDSMPEILRNHGIYTHLVTDHQHYWEDGGATYHNRYSSYELIRGQEGDLCRGEVKDPEIPKTVAPRDNRQFRQDFINRKYVKEEADFPQAKTFAAGLEFIRTNHEEDNWFLQIETFDPHEPFHSPSAFKSLYPHDYHGDHFDWPPYREVRETKEEVEHCRFEYAALISMCDAYLGRVLDVMDELNLWDDTMLIVNTDHGFLLGEHGYWAKMVAPFYNEIAHVPLFIWDPRSKVEGEVRHSLVQMIDMAPTLLEYFGVETPKDMQGQSLKNVILRDEPIREAALFGMHGGHVNCTDGRYVYMRAPVRADNQPLYEYTLMPTHMASRFSVAELSDLSLSGPFSFTKGCQVLRISGNPSSIAHSFGTLLFDVDADPMQEHPIDSLEIQGRMTTHMIRLMTKNDAPKEQFERMGLAE